LSNWKIFYEKSNEITLRRKEFSTYAGFLSSLLFIVTVSDEDGEVGDGTISGLNKEIH